MTYRTTLKVEVEMEAPAPENLRLRTLRQIGAAKLEELRALYPAAEHIALTLVIFCDPEQRILVADLPGFVPAHRAVAFPTTRLDFGFCESFRFKWKHTDEKGEVVRG